MTQGSEAAVTGVGAEKWGCAWKEQPGAEPCLSIQSWLSPGSAGCCPRARDGLAAFLIFALSLHLLHSCCWLWVSSAVQEHVNVILQRTRETARSHFTVPFGSPCQGSNLFISQCLSQNTTQP